MRLDQYLSEHGLSDLDFGTRIGRSRSAVSRLRRGETMPDWETVARIASETDGAVTPNDFLSAQATPTPTPFTADPKGATA